MVSEHDCLTVECKSTIRGGENSIEYFESALLGFWRSPRNAIALNRKSFPLHSTASTEPLLCTTEWEIVELPLPGHVPTDVSLSQRWILVADGPLSELGTAVCEAAQKAFITISRWPDPLPAAFSRVIVILKPSVDILMA